MLPNELQERAVGALWIEEACQEERLGGSLASCDNYMGVVLTGIESSTLVQRVPDFPEHFSGQALL